MQTFFYKNYLTFLKFYSNWFYIDFRNIQMSAIQEAQSDELLALASIYDEEEFCMTESRQKGKIHLCLELPPNFRLLVKGEILCRIWSKTYCDFHVILCL